MRFRVVMGAVGLAAMLAACGSDGAKAIGAADRADTAATTSSADIATTAGTSAPSTPAPGTTSGGAPAVTVAAATETRGAPPAVTAPPAAVPPAPNDPPPTTETGTTLPPSAPPPPPTTAPPPVPAGKQCVVALHGKGGGPGPEWTDGAGVRHSSPGGNAPGWGGLQWLYYPASNYQTARNIVANDVSAGGCGRVIVYGFSNGAAFAAKLYCRGETFGGAVIGYVIDDPVVDHAVEGCARPPVKVSLYWTGEINVADGWPCGDWTCEGDSTIGIARYEAAIGIVRKQSIYTSHQPYGDPPEFHSWF